MMGDKAYPLKANQFIKQLSDYKKEEDLCVLFEKAYKGIHFKIYNFGLF